MGSSGCTGHGPATKITKVTKTTQNFFHVLFVLFVFFVAFVAEPWAVQSTDPGWPQFRGSPRLTGAAGEVPAAPALKWTYEAGETIESSAAIADGVEIERRILS